jgi:hypothetical protein
MRSKTFLKIAILVILIAAAFRVGTAYAATGCFTDTNGHPYEVAICWLKANGIVSGTTFSPNTAATRATVAQWLYKQVQIPPTTGVILITPGNAEWHKYLSTDDINFKNYSNQIYLSKATTGNAYLTLQPSIPTALYGRSLKLLGVELCYTAAGNAYLDYLEINTFTSTDGSGTRVVRFSDITDRSDSACRYYVLSTPFTLTSKSGANIYINVSWSTPGVDFIIARTTFVLQATAAKTVPPSADSAEAVILTESSGSTGEYDTAAP